MDKWKWDKKDWEFVKQLNESDKGCETIKKHYESTHKNIWMHTLEDSRLQDFPKEPQAQDFILVMEDGLWVIPDETRRKISIIASECDFFTVSG